MGLREWWNKLTGKGLDPGSERGFRDNSEDTIAAAASETRDDNPDIDRATDDENERDPVS